MPVSIREMHLLGAPGTQAALGNLFDGFTSTQALLSQKLPLARHWSCQVVRDNNIRGLKESKTRGKEAALAALGTGQPWESSTCASSAGEAASQQLCEHFGEAH